jgi:hypothetical protein
MINARITYRDADFNVIEGISTGEFTLTIVGLELESPCKSAQLWEIKKANDISLSFDLAEGSTEAQTSVSIVDAFEVEMETESMSCYVEYKLYAQDPTLPSDDDTNWYSWEVLKSRLNDHTMK